MFWMTTALAEEAAEAAEKAEPGWWETMVEKFSEVTPQSWIVLGVLVVLGVILLAIHGTARKWSARMIAFGGLCIALSYILSCIRLYRMPQGGSVTPGSMLPLMLFAAAFGVGPGLLAGAVYGLLQYLQGGWFLNIWQFLLDYVLAYAALGITGLAKHWKGKWGLYAAMLIAAVCRAVSATLAGILFWETAPWASLVYNGTYLIPETVICIVLAILVAPPVMKTMKTV